MSPRIANPRDWRERIDEVEGPPDFQALAAPVLALTETAGMNEVYAAITEVCNAVREAPRSTCQAVRTVVCQHLKAVLKVQSPAALFDALLREKRPAEESPSTADEIVELAREHCDLFHDGDGRAFADVRTETHRETHPLRARSFARILRAAYFGVHEHGVSEHAIGDAVATLEGFALRDGPAREVFVRFGRDPDTGTCYLDLGDDRWRVVEIDPTGWRIVDEPPVRFIRPAGLRSLPEPSSRPAGSAPREPGAWSRFIRVAEADRPVIRAWLVAAILVRGPYLTLVLLGEQGSGKTTTARVLRLLVDPAKAPLRSPPREERDIVIAAGNGGIVAFDNVSRLSDTLADALCRLSTGAGFGTRALYTDDEEYLFEGRRPELLNGISNFVARDDLADRSGVVHVPRLESPEPEAEFWRAFEDARPNLLADLLDLASATITRQVEAKEILEREGYPRMADFAEVGVAADLASGGDGLRFLERYRALQGKQTAEILTENSVGAAILAFLKPGQEWRGTAKTLLAILSKDDARRALPDSPRGLTGALDRLKSALRHMGIYFGRTGRGEQRGLVLRRKAEVQAEAAPPGSAQAAPHATPDSNGKVGKDPASAATTPEAGFDFNSSAVHREEYVVDGERRERGIL